MKCSQAWVEEISYVACPECGDTIDLGAGIIVSAGDVEVCKCGCDFKIIEPE